MKKTREREREKVIQKRKKRLKGLWGAYGLFLQRDGDKKGKRGERVGGGGEVEGRENSFEDQQGAKLWRCNKEQWRQAASRQSNFPGCGPTPPRPGQGLR